MVSPSNLATQVRDKCGTILFSCLFRCAHRRVLHTESYIIAISCNYKSPSYLYKCLFDRDSLYMWFKYNPWGDDVSRTIPGQHVKVQGHRDLPYLKCWTLVTLGPGSGVPPQLFDPKIFLLVSWSNIILYSMMTSSNGNISRVAGHLWWEFTGHRWIPRTKASDAELWCFLWSAPE